MGPYLSPLPFSTNGSISLSPPILPHPSTSSLGSLPDTSDGSICGRVVARRGAAAGFDGGLPRPVFSKEHRWGAAYPKAVLTGERTLQVRAQPSWSFGWGGSAEMWENGRFEMWGAARPNVLQDAGGGVVCCGDFCVSPVRSGEASAPELLA